MTLRPIISGLVGGLVAVLLTTYIANRVGKAGIPGRLRYGGFMWGLAVSCLILAFLPVAATLAGSNDQFWAKAALFVGFGTGAAYCFGEAAFVRGSYDEQGVRFHTPWTGGKNETWRDLVSVEFVSSCSWYTLTFASGTKVRLSQYLPGHAAALEMASKNHSTAASSDA